MYYYIEFFVCQPCFINGLMPIQLFVFTCTVQENCYAHVQKVNAFVSRKACFVMMWFSGVGSSLQKREVLAMMYKRT